jgi:hypothetical protein
MNVTGKEKATTTSFQKVDLLLQNMGNLSHKMLLIS